MQLFITIVHVILCFALILIILLQPGKEGAAVLGGGGGGNQMYGPRGQANFLGRATTVVAALFMVTSITLAYRSSERTQAGTGGIEDAILEIDAEESIGQPAEAAPAPEPTPEPAPAAAPVPSEGDEPAPEGDAEGSDDTLDENPPEADAPVEAPATEGEQ